MKKETVKTTHISFLDTPTKKVTAVITAVVVIVLVVILMLIESNNGKLIIKNNTDLKLEYVDTSFVNSVTEDPSELKRIENIDAKKTIDTAIEPVEIYYKDTNLELRFKFENHKEMLVDAGIFNGTLTGNAKLEFKKTDDPNILKLKVKASNGILPSNTIKCNEEYTIDLSNDSIPE